MIQVRNLTRYYGEFPALRDVSFDLKAGEIVGLLGLNGAGKSTTLKVLAGVMVPSIGSVPIDGHELSDHPADRARIGYLPEDPPLYLEMTVAGFLRHIGRLKGMSGAEVERRLPEVIKLADLGGREHQVLGTLSHGYRKRVGIAQAVINDPKLVILDEPISGLDPAQIAEMRKVVRALGTNRAVILSSHILSEVSATCDRILVIGNGRLVAQGTESELTARAGRESHLVVTVRGDGAKFAAFLEQSPRVERIVSQKAAQEGLAMVHFEMKGDQREQLLPEIAAAGFGLRLVDAPQDELEEIFLGLAQREAA
ncbi:MAG: ABC transporter ATP-binding protein [Bryobacterales bacterium]